MAHQISLDKRRTLVVCHQCPSFSGPGAVIRAAGIIQTLALYEEVYLVIITETPLGGVAREMTLLCKKILCLQVVSGTDGLSFLSSGPNQQIILAACLPKEIGQFIKRFYDDHQLSLLFIFRLETFLLFMSQLQEYPQKYLDLDEVGSRKIELINHLKTMNGQLSQANKTQGVLLRAIEKMALPLFNKVFVSSVPERDMATKLTANGHIEVLPNTYPACPIVHDRPRKKHHEILFVGSLFYYPNEDAVRYFCYDILPLIQRFLDKEIIFNIIGFGCPETLKGIAQIKGVNLLRQQKDLTPFYLNASMAVVPLRAGTGTRIKILEAFVHNCPVVSTSIGASGLDVTHDKNILIADGPAAFAQACLSLLQSPSTAKRLSRAGRELHQKYYSPISLAITDKWGMLR